MLILTVFVAIVAIAAVVWMMEKRAAVDGVRRCNDERRSSCRLVGRGELVEGKQHIPVAMALSWSTLYYENGDLEASLDLHSIDEVEYADELVTGQSLGGGKVMRLRCFSKVFEFVVDPPTASQWQAALPAVRLAS